MRGLAGYLRVYASTISIKIQPQLPINHLQYSNPLFQEMSAVVNPPNVIKVEGNAISENNSEVFIGGKEDEIQGGGFTC